MQYSKLRRNSFVHKYIYVVFLFQKTKRGLRKSFMQSNSVFTVQPLQSISTPLCIYKQAATSSQEFQDSCTWFMQNNSVFTVQALQSISILYMYTNKLQQVLRSSKIPAHGSCKTILSLLCSHYNLYLSPLHVYKQAATRFSGIPRSLHMVHAKQFCLYCAAITIYIYLFKCIQTSCNEFSGIPRSLHMVHAKQFCIYSPGITIYIYSFTCIQTSCNRFSGIPRSLHMVHAKQFCLYCAGIQTSCNRFSQSLHMVHASVFTQPFTMYTNKLQQVLRSSKIPAHGSCKTILSLLCRHYNLYLLLYMYTNKLQQVLRSSKIPAHGPLNVILCTTQMQQVLRKVKTPDVVQPCKATLRVPRTCPGHQKEGHGSIPLE